MVTGGVIVVTVLVAGVVVALMRGLGAVLYDLVISTEPHREAKIALVAAAIFGNMIAAIALFGFIFHMD